MHGERGVRVVEADDEPEAERVGAHRVGERPAELAVARLRLERPADRVDDALERARDAPDLLDAERVDLRVLGLQAEVLDGGAREHALHAVGQHGRVRGQLGAGLERRQLLALPAAALVAGADAAHGAVRDEQPLGVGLGQHHHAELLGALGHEAREPREREHVVALVVHRRRHDRQPRRARAREQVDGLVLDRAVARHLLERGAREQLEQRRRLHDGARELMRADRPALVDERDRHLAERLRDGRVVLEQLRQPDRAGQPGRPAADDRDADLELLVGRRLGRGDDLGRRERRGVRSGRDRHAAIVLGRIGGARARPSGTRRVCHCGQSRARPAERQVALAACATWPSRRV